MPTEVIIKYTKIDYEHLTNVNKKVMEMEGKEITELNIYDSNFHHREYVKDALDDGNAYLLGACSAPPVGERKIARAPSPAEGSRRWSSGCVGSRHGKAWRRYTSGADDITRAPTHPAWCSTACAMVPE